MEEVFTAIRSSRDKFGKHQAKLRCMRMQNFFEHGTICIECKVIGAVFKVERHKGFQESKNKNSGYHLNLYTASGTLMTMDHIIPTSRGGKNLIDNVQPMCTKCNSRKANCLPGETYKHISGTRKKQHRRYRKGKNRKVHIIDWNRFFSIKWFIKMLRYSIEHMNLPQLPKRRIRKRKLLWHHIKIGEWNKARAKKRTQRKQLQDDKNRDWRLV